jgi:hypothetical protein
MIKSFTLDHFNALETGKYQSDYYNNSMTAVNEADQNMLINAIFILIVR